MVNNAITLQFFCDWRLLYYASLPLIRKMHYVGWAAFVHLWVYAVHVISSPSRVNYREYTRIIFLKKCYVHVPFPVALEVPHIATLQIIEVP
jgi:hypothetical protein